MKNYEKMLELKNKLQKYIKNYESKKTAWESVTFNTKKDGTPFQKLSMAINGASFGKYSIIEDKDHPYLTVSGNYNGVYISDHLQAYFYVDELPKDDERRQNLTYSFVRQTTPKTLEELKTAIKDTITKYEHHIEVTKKELELVDVYYPKYLDLAMDLKQQLNKDLANTEYTTLFYTIREDIESIF